MARYRPNPQAFSLGSEQGPSSSAEHLREELEKIAQALVEPDYFQLTEWHSEPPKPRTGMVVLADGTNWNPGAGQGVYVYYAGAWNKLG